MTGRAVGAGVDQLARFAAVLRDPTPTRVRFTCLDDPAIGELVATYEPLSGVLEGDDDVRADGPPSALIYQHATSEADQAIADAVSAQVEAMRQGSQTSVASAMRSRFRIRSPGPPEGDAWETAMRVVTRPRSRSPP